MKEAVYSLWHHFLLNEVQDQMRDAEIKRQEIQDDIYYSN